jgi:hypothetical protein
MRIQDPGQTLKSLKVESYVKNILKVGYRSKNIRYLRSCFLDLVNIKNITEIMIQALLRVRNY